MEPWQSIDSAPRDGSRILLYREHAQFGVTVIIGYWKKANSRPYWSHDAEDELGVMEARKFQPTFWMPLPAFPVSPTPTNERTLDDLNRVGHLKRFKRR